MLLNITVVLDIFRLVEESDLEIAKQAFGEEWIHVLFSLKFYFKSSIYDN